LSKYSLLNLDMAFFLPYWLVVMAVWLLEQVEGLRFDLWRWRGHVAGWVSSVWEGLLMSYKNTLILAS
jgi:hypothetical protein